MNHTIDYKRITIYGLVQGIGFRPYVARLAMNYGITGEVCNWGGAVRILASAPATFLDGFLDELQQAPPPLSEILHIKIDNITSEEYEKALSEGNASHDKFHIVESREEEAPLVMLPPDLPVCEACLAEMKDPDNRRHKHFLISCTHCGPRYSIIKKSPYDRINTAMDKFDFCPECYKEYTDPKSRRFHAQTVSCHHCGPQIELTVFKSIPENRPETGTNGKSGNFITYPGEEGFEKAVELLRKGHILAVKGIGGYHFIASPYMDDTVKALRELKHREQKAFAVCFSSLEEIKEYGEVSKEEEALLLSKARPIVLLKQKEHLRPFSKEVCKQSRYIGAFLAYTPILVELCERLGPLIATSANLSDSPIIHREADILSYPRYSGYPGEKSHPSQSNHSGLPGQLSLPSVPGYTSRSSEDNQCSEDTDHQHNRSFDYKSSSGFQFTEDESRPCFAGVLSHDREIMVSQDDSVAWVVNKKPQLIRRARGYTPLPLFLQAFEDYDGPSVLATGGELKSAFCLQKGPMAYVSQYLGDLGRSSSLDIYKENLRHMKELLKITPGIVACDLHPDYATTRLAQELELPVIRVQHHHSHIASVMAEKGLEGPVIGLSFDGTGYGTDGSIWGGEFLICEKGSFTRVACLKPVQMLMGDESMKDCLKTSTAYLHAYGLKEAVLDERYPIISKALDMKINTIMSSSMGRLFDAISSILGLCQFNSYEGEAAILLENAAWRATGRIRDNIVPQAFDIINENDLLSLDAGPFLKALAEEKAKGNMEDSRKCFWALAFHRALAQGVMDILEKLSESTGIKEVVLSGGVFQNRILTEDLLQRIENKGYRGHINSLVPTNDGGICLGQAYVALEQWKALN